MLNVSNPGGGKAATDASLLIYIHLVCRLEAFSLVDGGTYYLTVANYRMLIGWQMFFFGHD